MQLSEIMARNVPTIGPEATLQQAASEMALLDTTAWSAKQSQPCR